MILWIGARVIVSDTRQATLDEAVKLGVPKEDIVPIGTSIPDFVNERGLGNSIDVVADFVGLKQTVSDAQNIGESSSSSFRRQLPRPLAKQALKTQCAWVGNSSMLGLYQMRRLLMRSFVSRKD